MADAIPCSVTQRYAIVSGANRGIGFEICRQLADKGVVVVLTARDERRGVEALEKLKTTHERLSGRVIFHQLDVVDPTSVATLVEFIKTQFGKLDILVNNAGISGGVIKGDPLFFEQLIEKHGYQIGMFEKPEIQPREGKFVETYELARQCLEINYYGAKRMIEAFIPLLELSDSPRIVNVSSGLGVLKFLPNEWAVSMLSEAERLTEDKIDVVLNEFVDDYEKGCLEAKSWPLEISAYKLSKMAMNAYTRIAAKRYPTFRINCLCPGFVRTDMTANTGKLSVEEGAESAVRLAMVPDDGPSGLYFLRHRVSEF